MTEQKYECAAMTAAGLPCRGKHYKSGLCVTHYKIAVKDGKIQEADPQDPPADLQPPVPGQADAADPQPPVQPDPAEPVHDGPDDIPDLDAGDHPAVIPEESRAHYPDKECPDCKRHESVAYKTNQERGRQYRICLAPKNPMQCPRCGFKGSPPPRLGPVSRRQIIKKEGRIYTDAKCTHPVCGVMFSSAGQGNLVELCGKTFSVDRLKDPV